ncbi:protein of unknown function [Candidatus Hydrogenisulfobacillus filiaventi]|uniref:DUF58 domain-containing protein n=1 Tax=Candidatus Hydrogenisulfobacillus filiaventi TaxID=2707344 RepID=A0A6F8ZJN7_9FIRM|nr:DUF58 domain-containing protein [Bacillota bacterium]CAB1129978.1 protein of unknown function [Candidatus Hydrogenisulfobacillus filiaventi]
MKPAALPWWAPPALTTFLLVFAWAQSSRLAWGTALAAGAWTLVALAGIAPDPRRLELHRAVSPGRLEAGEAGEVVIRLRRPGWPWSVLEVEDPGLEGLGGRWLLWAGGRGWAELRYRLPALPRGVYPLPPLTVGVGDLWGVWRRPDRRGPGEELRVWPRPLEAGPPGGAEAEPGKGPGIPHRGPWGSPAGLRPYRAGDRPSRLDWRRLTRGGPPLTKDLEEGAHTGPLLIVLDSPAFRPGPAFERALSLAAGLIRAAARQGQAVGLWDAGPPVRYLPPRVDAAIPLLDHLAAAAARGLEAGGRLQTALPPAAATVVLTTEPERWPAMPAQQVIRIGSRWEETGP